MKNRSNFREPIKAALAKRAGNSCSFPNCEAVTEGPSAETTTSVSKTGMACHIYAASDGPSARRVNTNISEEELIDISNGIWMCYKHGKLIDTDESTYTVEQLKTWREIAEVRAKLWHEFGRRVEFTPKHFFNIPLPETKVGLESLGQENQIIGETISRSCISIMWGANTAHAIRDALIEIVRNAFEHGNATKITLEVKPKSICLIDNGKDYESTKLLDETKQGGGYHSIDELTNNFKNAVYFSSHNDGKNNHHVFSVITNSEEIKELTPCCIEISKEIFWGDKPSFQIAEYCKTVYVIFPEYFALSDAFKISKIVTEYLPENKEYIFVGSNLSERAIELLKEQLGNMEIINYG